jgi:hypothetical protein
MYQRGNQKPEVKKDRQHNGQKQRTHNDLQNAENKDRATQSQIKNQESGRVGSFCSIIVWPSYYS